MYGPASQASPGLPTHGARLVTHADVPLDGVPSGAPFTVPCVLRVRRSGPALDRLAHRDALAGTEHDRLGAVHQPGRDPVRPAGDVPVQRGQVDVTAQLDVTDLGHRYGRRVEAAGHNR